MNSPSVPCGLAAPHGAAVRWLEQGEVSVVTEVLPGLQNALIGRYVIEQELGRGGMGIVYLARDLRHDRQVALKVLRPELAASVGADRFLREIRIAASLQHPHVLGVHDSGEADGHLFYVMPYIEGESLARLLAREQRLSLDDALRLAREVAEALDFAHQHGIVHRDVKPENILFSDGHALVADFGVARAVSEGSGAPLTDSGIAIGTPAYMSPEQATGAADVDGRSDQYALGCVVYEALAGEPPFTGPTAQAVIARHVQERPPSLAIVRPTVTPAMEQAVQRALAKVPTDRFPTAAAFADALEAGAPAARPDATWTPRRVAVATAGLALTAILAFVAVRAPSMIGGAGRAAPPLDLRHVAVLYFSDNSEGGAQEHLANGFTEALIDELGAVDALRVISTHGVRPYRHAQLPADSIARELNVGLIVEGSVARYGDRVRLSVRLVDGATGTLVGRRTLDRPFAEIFVLQDELVDEVSRFLRERLGQEILLRQRRSGPANVAAWEMFQRAELWLGNAQTFIERGEYDLADGELSKADSLLEASAALDPNWVDAVVARGWLARQQAVLAEIRRATAGPVDPPAVSEMSSEAWIERGLEHAARALAIAPTAPAARELRGALHFLPTLTARFGPRDSLLLSAERDLRFVVEADPSRARAWYFLSQLLQDRGNFAEAYVAAERALEADAYLLEARRVINGLLFTALDLERFDDARKWCTIGLRRYPDDPRLADCALIILGWAGYGPADIAHAWAELGAVERRDSTSFLSSTWAYRRMAVAAVLARSGLRDSAIAVMDRTRAALPDARVRAGMLVDEAHVRVLLDDADGALVNLRTYLEANPQWRDYVAKIPWFRPLWGDRRFQRLVSPDG